MHSFRFRTVIQTIVAIVSVCDAIIYQCDHYENDGNYNVRYCALFGVTILHDAEDVDFSSEYPRPYHFEFHQSNLTEIPRALFTTFPEMQTIRFTSTGIVTINKFTFENAKQLLELYLKRNQLTVLNNFIFKGCDRLHVLDLSHNQLEDVKEKAFNAISTLYRLDLSHNRLVTLPNDVFTDLLNLDHLSLNDNLLTVLGESMFKANRLSSLNLDFNRIAVLNLVDGLNLLQKVTLRGNLLRTMTVPGGPKLIDLSHNNLTELIVPPGDHHLQELFLSHNLLPSIANVSTLKKLITLDVSFNPLQSLPLTTFMKMNDLNKLNLEATNLTTLDHGIFSHQVNLSWLDISYNRLQALDLTVLTAAHDLTRLHIDGNNLTRIDYQWIPRLFPMLSYLGLYDNVWNCSYLVELVHFCRQKSIGITPLKTYGTVFELSNVQGIYCLSSSRAHLPVVKPIEHSIEDGPTVGSGPTTGQLLQMLQRMNETTEWLMHKLNESGQGHPQTQSATAIVTTASCSAMHFYNYQVFILLILSIILIINIGFLLWVQYNANARRAVDQMIIFRRGQGASIQSDFNGDL